MNLAHQDDSAERDGDADDSFVGRACFIAAIALLVLFYLDALPCQ